MVLADSSVGKRGSYSSSRQRARRQRILSVTHRLIESEGLGGITMSRIAALSKVSDKTLYNVFGTRQQLLIDVASMQLDDMQAGDRVGSADPGIPQILAFTEAAMDQFRSMPEYMRAVISIVVAADVDQTTARHWVSRIQRFAHAALEIAADREELRRGTDCVELSKLIAANQWGVALLWERGVLSLDELIRQANLAQCITLLPFCVGSRRQWLDKRLESLLGGAAEPAGARLMGASKARLAPGLEAT